MKSCCKMLAVALAGLTLAGAAQAQTTLRYKFKEGEKLEYVVDQDQKMSMSINGMDIDMKVKMVMEMDWQTLKVDNQGAAEVKVVISRVKMAMDGPTGNVEVDSKDKEEPGDPIGQIFAQIVKAIGGMEMTFTSDATGDLRDTKISEGTAKKLKGIPGIDKLGGDMFSPDNMKSMMASNMVLPKEPVSKGKSWTQKTNQKLPFGKLTGETTYTYEGEIEKNGKKLEKIAVKPDIKIEPDPNSPIQIKVKGGSGKGTTLFDNTAGRVIESTNEQKMEMELEIGGMTINQNITQTTTMRLKGTERSKEPPR
jgi:hypothetical protein